MQALQTGVALGKSGTVWCFDRLGYLPWLSSLPHEMRARNMYLACIREIAQHDQENGSAYIETLAAYLDHSLNASETAQALFIHRNTLLKRLNRMQELWSLAYEDPYFIINLHIALKDWLLNR
jgi:purine catabolism regulator